MATEFPTKLSSLPSTFKGKACLLASLACALHCYDEFPSAQLTLTYSLGLALESNSMIAEQIPSVITGVYTTTYTTYFFSWGH